MISIVIPAYNVGKFIHATIDSIKNQTYENWELIIVNDKSTDDTYNILEEYKSKLNNLTVINRDINSGSCRVPRLEGIIASSGDYICSIDADDFIEPSFLYKLIKRQKETSSDVVLGTMLFSDEQGNLLENKQIPSKNYDLSIILNSIDAFKSTLNGWKIALNGMLVKSCIYKNFALTQISKELNSTYGIELEYRRLLCSVSKISMTDAKYFYRMQANSITHTKTVKSFDNLKIITPLYNLIIDNLPKDEEVMNLFESEFISTLYYSYIKLLLNTNLINSERKYVLRQIEDLYKIIRRNKMKGSTTFHYILSRDINVLKCIAFISIMKSKLTR